jgi:hypothetical protein
MDMSRKTTGLLPSALLASGLGLVIVGERVLGSGLARVALTGGGIVLLVVAAALRGRALFASEGDQRAVEGQLLFSYAGVGLALVLYALSTDTALAWWGLKEESAVKVGTVLSALWVTLMAISLSALLFMELVYARMPIAPSVEVRRVRAAGNLGLTLALSLIFLLSVNYVASERDLRRDLSYFKTTNPSAATLDLVRRLDQPLEVVLFYRRAEDVLEQIKPYFDQLARASARVTVRVTDVAWVPELARTHRIRDNGYALLLWGKDKAKRGESIEVGTELTEARRTLRKLDGLFQQKFRKLTIPPRVLYLTTGHGERNSQSDQAHPGEGTRDMDAILKRLNIKTSALGVAEGLGSAVPEGATAVAIVGPRERFLPEETRALLAYLRGGGRLLLMLDPDVDAGLTPLLQGLGVVLLPGVIASEKYYLKRSYGPSDRVLVYSNRYSSHPAVTTASRHRSEVATIFAKGAAVEKLSAGASGPKPTVSFALRTAEGFWRDLNGDFLREQSEPEQSLNMIAAVTVNQEKAPEARAVVIGDGDFVTDQLLGNAGNALVFVDSLSWLIADEQISGDVSSEEDVPIEHTRDRDRAWFYATSFAVPLPILGLGIWIARRRRRRPEVGV